MRNKVANVLVLVAGFLAFAAPLAAHHGSAAFDNDKLISVKGTITDWIWANPHCILKVDVKDDSNNIVHWTTELNNPPEMIRNGWTKQSIKPGDEITVFMIPAKNGNPIARVQKIILANGQVLVAMAGIGVPERKDNPDSSNAPKQ